MATKIWGKQESGLTTVQLKQDPPVCGTKFYLPPQKKLKIKKQHELRESTQHNTRTIYNRKFWIIEYFPADLVKPSCIDGASFVTTSKCFCLLRSFQNLHSSIHIESHSSDLCCVFYVKAYLQHTGPLRKKSDGAWVSCLFLGNSM